MTTKALLSSASSYLSAAMTGLIALSALAGTTAEVAAQTVGLAKAGPVDPATNYPLFYEDTNGLRLGLCRSAANCAFLLPGPGPEHYPSFPGDPATNFPDESFYFLAAADMVGVGTARALITIALEAAFLNGGVAYQENIVFARLRIRLTGLVDGATYTIAHPYGQEVLVAGVDGPLPGTINVTRDIGIGAAMNFQLALGGDIGPFLVPVGFFGGFPGQFISDGATEVQVTGSPLNTNYFRLTGPSANTLFPAFARAVNRAQDDTFVITGQVAPQLGASLDHVTVQKTLTDTAVNVWASTAAGQSLSASIGGAAGIAMQGGGPDGLYFARAVFPAGTPAPASVAVTNQTDFPSTTFGGAAVIDTVEILGATYAVGGGLTVTARTSDKTGNPVLTASANGIVAAALTNLGGGNASATIALLPGSVPPKTVRVESAAGGSAIANVVISGAGAQGGGAQLLANAGADQTVAAGALVNLSGLASTGTIVAFAWSHDAGASINLIGGNSATPSFVAPAVGVNAQVDITLTLVVQDAFGGSIDTVVVHVLGPTGPLDVVSFTDARFSVGKAIWRLAGSNSLQQGQAVKLYVGAIGDRSRLIATVAVTATGAWTYVGVVTPSAQPLQSDTTVWAESTLVGTPGVATIRRL